MPHAFLRSTCRGRYCLPSTLLGWDLGIDDGVDDLVPGLVVLVAWLHFSPHRNQHHFEALVKSELVQKLVRVPLGACSLR